MNKQITTALLVVAALFASCSKKDKDEDSIVPGKPAKEAFSNCRIIKITREGYPTVTCSYNSEGQLSGWTSGEYAATISRSGTKLVINRYDEGELEIKETVELNNAGLATKVEIEYLGKNAHTDHIDFTYDEKNQLIKRTDTYSGNVSPTHYTYQWHEGNMVAEQKGGGEVVSSYTYTGDPAQPADWFNTIAIINGYTTVRNKNLVHTTTYKNGGERVHSYNKNESGLIQAVHIDTKNLDYTENFTYECDE